MNVKGAVVIGTDLIIIPISYNKPAKLQINPLASSVHQLLVENDSLN